MANSIEARAESVASEIQREVSYKDGRELVVSQPGEIAASCLKPFSEVCGLLVAAPLPRRPNRNRPLVKQAVEPDSASEEESAAEWAALERDALSAEELRQVADYLRESGLARGE